MNTPVGPRRALVLAAYVVLVLVTVAVLTVRSHPGGPESWGPVEQQRSARLAEG